MKGQDKLPTRTAYDIYMTRGTESFFSKRYYRPSAAKRRADELEEVWGRVGYKAEIKTIVVELFGPEN